MDHHNKQLCANAPDFTSARESQVKLTRIAPPIHVYWLVMVDSYVIQVNSWWVPGNAITLGLYLWWCFVESLFQSYLD